MSGREGLWLLARRLCLVLACATLGLFAMTARSVVSGQNELEAAERAFDAGDLRQAVVHARRSASWWVPGAPHVQRAYERLNVIARGAEAAGQPEVALLAWSAVRGAALEGAHPLREPPPELAVAELAIARLQASALLQRNDGQQPHTERDLLRRLRVESGPSALWLGVLGLGFLLVIAGLAWLALRGVSAAGDTVPRQLLLGAVLTLVGAACWTLAAYQA